MEAKDHLLGFVLRFLFCFYCFASCLVWCIRFISFVLRLPVVYSFN